MTEEERKSYELLYEKIIFVDKYRILKPHWIKFHNYIEKLQKENSELQEKIENLKMNIAINYTENSKLRHIVMSLPNGLEILEKL